MTHLLTLLLLLLLLLLSQRGNAQTPAWTLNPGVCLQSVAEREFPMVPAFRFTVFRNVRATHVAKRRTTDDDVRDRRRDDSL